MEQRSETDLLERARELKEEKRAFSKCYLQRKMRISHEKAQSLITELNKECWAEKGQDSIDVLKEYWRETERSIIDIPKLDKK